MAAEVERRPASAQMEMMAAAELRHREAAREGLVLRPPGAEAVRRRPMEEAAVVWLHQTAAAVVVLPAPAAEQAVSEEHHLAALAGRNLT